MKKYRLLLISMIFLWSCDSEKKLIGRYRIANLQEIEILDSEQFKYYQYAPGVGLDKYSMGSYRISNKMLFLNGYTDSNINLSSMKVQYIDKLKNDSIFIHIKYTQNNNDFINTTLFLNDTLFCVIRGDTNISVSNSTTSIQIKTQYCPKTGYRILQRRIDSLNSIKLERERFLGKEIYLDYSIGLNDFYRIPFKAVYRISGGHVW